MRRKYGNAISLIFMIIITCIAQILTLAKSSLVAGHFGATSALDAYNFANSIVSFVFGFISSAISTVIIPNYVHKTNRKEVDSFITILYGCLAVIIVTIMVLRFQIVGLFSNRDELFVNLACNVLLILLMSNYLLAITNITAAYYQCIGKYNIPKILNLITQLIVVFALICMKNLSIIQYAKILAGGVVINFIIDIFTAIKLGWRFKPSFFIHSKETIELFRLFIPIVISTGIYQVSLMTDSTIATRLDEGKLTILTYSSQIASMVNSVIIGNLVIYSYPKIVKRIKEKENKKVFWEQTSFFHLITWLIIAGYVCVGHEMISVLFEHGKFTALAVKGVFIGSLLYIIGQQSNIVRDLMYRYFYAVGDTKTTASNSVLVSVVNISVSLILVRYVGFYGIILGTIIASFASLLRIFVQFNKKIGFGVPIKNIFFSLFTNIGIAGATMVIVLFTKSKLCFSGKLEAIFLYGIETVIVYVILVFLLKKKETIRALKSI